MTRIWQLVGKGSVGVVLDGNRLGRIGAADEKRKYPCKWIGIRVMQNTIRVQLNRRHIDEMFHMPQLVSCAFSWYYINGKNKLLLNHQDVCFKCVSILLLLIMYITNLLKGLGGWCFKWYKHLTCLIGLASATYHTKQHIDISEHFMLTSEAVLDILSHHCLTTQCGKSSTPTIYTSSSSV